MTNKVKTIADKVNPHQQQAIDNAKQGEYSLIIASCVGCQRAINKVESLYQTPYEAWKNKTIKHYTELKCYLQSFIKTRSAKQQLKAAYEELENNG